MRIVATFVRVHLYPLAMNRKSMNTTTTTNLILPEAGVRRRPANANKAHPQGFHDVAPLNPTVMGEIETCHDAKAKLLQCRKNTKLATFNVQTLAIREVDKYYTK